MVGHEHVLWEGQCIPACAQKERLALCLKSLCCHAALVEVIVGGEMPACGVELW